MKRFPIIFIILLFASITNKLFSQEFAWKAGYSFAADNREYFNTYGFAQTILNSRGYIDFGFDIDSSQSVFVGINAMQIHGAQNAFEKPTYSLYYDFNKTNFRFRLGSFHKEKQYYPNIMLTDSLEYERPNMSGFELTLRNKSVSHTLLVDWLQQINNGEDEKFLAGVYGKMNYSHFYVKDYMYYTHHAWDTIIGGKNIDDNLSYGVYAGFDLDGFHYPLDTAAIEIGYVYSSQASRPEVADVSKGIHIRATTYYKALGIEYSYYKGEGTHLEYGDPLYRSGDYTRVNFVFAPNFAHGEKLFSSNTSKQVQFKFKYCMHFIKGDLNNSQQILLKVRLEK